MKYPFNPEMLDALPEKVAAHFRTLETDLIVKICEQIATGRMNEVSVQAMRALRSQGINLTDIINAIQRYSGMADKELAELFDEVIRRNQAYYSDVITLADITAPERLVDAAEIETIRRQTMAEFENISRSMGFLINGQFLKPEKVYTAVLDQAIISVQAGTTDYNKALFAAVKQLADSGIRTIDYNTGHVDMADVAARRAIMTGVAQINARYAEQAAEYLDTDLVEVSAHAGARNIGLMPENHELWQGKVYRWSQKTNPNSPQSTGSYPDFIQSCGYGSGEGIEGWNCRHQFYPFVEGVSERTYTDAELQKLTAKQFTYQGKQYDTYNASQRQRQIERTIRKYKREKAAFEAAGMKDEAAATTARIRALNVEYKLFSKAAGLPVQAARMKVI